MAMTSGEYFQWGVCKRRIECERPRLKQAKEVMENKYAIQSDRRIVGADKEVAAATIAFFPDKKIALSCNNSSSNSLTISPEKSSKPHNMVNNIMCTRSSNYSNRTNIMQDNKTLNLEAFVWPKLCLSLSRSEKEEDFLAMKGSKLPLRPKKRLKSIQRAINLVQRPKGLKAMDRVENDSD